MVKLGEFFLEDRAARFERTVDLRQDMAERETFQAFRGARGVLPEIWATDKKMEENSPRFRHGRTQIVRIGNIPSLDRF